MFASSVGANPFRHHYIHPCSLFSFSIVLYTYSLYHNVPDTRHETERRIAPKTHLNVHTHLCASHTWTTYTHAQMRTLSVRSSSSAAREARARIRAPLSRALAREWLRKQERARSSLICAYITEWMAPAWRTYIHKHSSTHIPAIQITSLTNPSSSEQNELAWYPNGRRKKCTRGCCIHIYYSIV